MLIALVSSACVATPGSPLVVTDTPDPAPSSTVAPAWTVAEPTSAGRTPRPVCEQYVTQDQEFPTTLEGLVAKADLIATGRLEGASAEVGRSDGGSLRFAQEFTVDSALKGEAVENDVITVQIYVGADGCAIALEGATPLNLGEEALVFL